MSKISQSSRTLTIIFLIAFFLVSCRGGTPAPVVFKGMIIPSVNVTSGRENVVAAESGDTLYSIARARGVAVQEIIALNELTAPYHLHVGQLIKLPETQFHMVRGGDTLYSISRHYGVDIFQLAQTNNLSHPYILVLGQKLQLYAVSKEWTAHQKKKIQPLPSTQGEFIWPVKGQVLSSFGPKSGGIHNDGIDISVKPGTLIRAAKPGIVVYAGDGLRGLGHLLLLRHDDGWITAYAHNEEILVSRGAKVEQGQTIARGGALNADAAPKLHFEIRRGTQAMDPLYYLPALQTSLGLV